MNGSLQSYFFLNYGKTNFLNIKTKKFTFSDTKLKYNNISIDTKLDTKFLGKIVNSTLQWTAHIDSLLIKLNAACYVWRTLKLMMSQQVLVMVYISYFHSIMFYGIILRGASPHSINIFSIKRNIKNDHKYLEKGVMQEII